MLASWRIVHFLKYKSYFPHEIHLVSYNFGTSGYRWEMIFIKLFSKSPSIFAMILLQKHLAPACQWNSWESSPRAEGCWRGHRFILHGKKFQSGITELMTFLCACLPAKMIILLSSRWLWVSRKLRTTAGEFILMSRWHWKVYDVFNMYLWV